MDWLNKISIFIVLFIQLSEHKVECQRRCSEDCPSIDYPICATLYTGPKGGSISCTFENTCKLKYRECVYYEIWTFRARACTAEHSQCEKYRAVRPFARKTTTKPLINKVIKKCKKVYQNVNFSIKSKAKRENREEDCVEE
ncbi:uncharacterized protein LOC142219513 [Haematobia irritans]|uniref:uncharacterized protein LOC142219513 n=1 Tax=Haematobia irritans TaxID=7368 RepID=UPI003F4FFA60